MTALWLGITNGMLAPRRGGPAGMNPILVASTRVPLRPGAHRLRPGAQPVTRTRRGGPGRPPKPAYPSPPVNLRQRP
jgi:hypothetical protein